MKRKKGQKTWDTVATKNNSHGRMLTPLSQNKTCQFLSKKSEHVEELKHCGGNANLFLAAVVWIMMEHVFDSFVTRAGTREWSWNFLKKFYGDRNIVARGREEHQMLIWSGCFAWRRSEIEMFETQNFRTKHEENACWLPGMQYRFSS